MLLDFDVTIYILRIQPIPYSFESYFACTQCFD